jgi:hypothetical protein
VLSLLLPYATAEHKAHLNALLSAY